MISSVSVIAVVSLVARGFGHCAAATLPHRYRAPCPMRPPQSWLWRAHPRTVCRAPGERPRRHSCGQRPSRRWPKMSSRIFRCSKASRRSVHGLHGRNVRGAGFLLFRVPHRRRHRHREVGSRHAQQSDRARKMVQMVAAINHDNFAGRQQVTCWTCHRSRDVPVVTPTLDTGHVYDAANLDPYDIFTGDPAPVRRSGSRQIHRGARRAQKLAAITSYTATGTSVGFGGFGKRRPRGNLRAGPRPPRYHALHRSGAGEQHRTFDGRAGWIATPLTVVGRYTLSGAELEGARLDAQLAFPSRSSRPSHALAHRTGSTINVTGSQRGAGERPRRPRGHAIFRPGLRPSPVRMVRYNNSPIGRVPTQVDYADYAM